MQIFVQELPENEIVIMKDRITETNSKAAVRGLIYILPYLLNVVADCSTFNTSTVDKRGSCRCI